MPILAQAVVALLIKLCTADVVVLAILKLAKWAVAKTDTPDDDEIVALLEKRFKEVK